MNNDLIVIRMSNQIIHEFIRHILFCLFSAVDDLTGHVDIEME